MVCQIFFDILTWNITFHSRNGIILTLSATNKEIRTVVTARVCYCLQTPKAAFPKSSLTLHESHYFKFYFKISRKKRIISFFKAAKQSNIICNFLFMVAVSVKVFYQSRIFQDLKVYNFSSRRKVNIFIFVF